ncbi:MAG: hypothetical protein WC501_05360 [Candidatus Micrarchaeia archaeon]
MVKQKQKKEPKPINDFKGTTRSKRRSIFQRVFDAAVAYKLFSDLAAGVTKVPDLYSDPSSTDSLLLSGGRPNSHVVDAVDAVDLDGLRKHISSDPSECEREKVPFESIQEPIIHKRGAIQYDQLYTKVGKVELLSTGTIAKTYSGRRIVYYPNESKFEVYTHDTKSGIAVNQPTKEEIELFRNDIVQAAQTDQKIAEFIKNNPGLGISLKD